MGDRRLRKKWQHFVDNLNIPSPFSLEEFCNVLEIQRGRKIEILPLPRSVTLNGACGVWLFTDTTDFIFYEAETSPLHRMHIIAHELAHILAAEPGDEDGAILDVSDLMPLLDPSVVRQALMRADYTNPREKSAEMVASLILERAIVVSRTSKDDDLGRLGEMLGTER